MPKPFPKKSKARKLTVSKVQILFNEAIRRRDVACITCHATENLQSSHFIAVGGSGGLRFYPPNAHAQCCGCHRFVFHMGDVMPYVNWMRSNVDELDWMDANKKGEIKYNQAVLSIIKALCESDQLDDLTKYIEGKLSQRKIKL